jgi:iron complex outermembrane receptor protein
MPLVSAAQTDTIVVFGEASERGLDATTSSASRLGLTQRETPAIVDVLTQEDFKTQGVRTAIEAMNAVPGVNAGNLPGAIGGASMRGFTRGAVNYLYDGVRLASSGAEVRNWDAFVFERIEVLKGPASVITGEGALAGAINFVPKRAKLGESGGDLFLSYGGFDTMRIGAGGNVALANSAALRGDVATMRSSGFVDDTDSESVAATGSLLLAPSDRLSLTFSLDHFEDDFSTAYFGLPLVSTAVAREPSDIVVASNGLVADKAMRDVNFNVADGAMDSSSTWLRAKVDYELTVAWRLVNETSWYDSDRLWRNSEDFTFSAGTGLLDRLTTLITHDHSFRSNRTSFAFDGGEGQRRNRFVAGVEVSGTDFATSRRFGATTSVAPFVPVRDLFPTTDDAATFDTRQEVNADVESVAWFFEDALGLTPRWLLVFGARLDNYELTRSIENLIASTRTEYGNDFDPWSWRVGTVFDVAEQTQLFAQVSTAATPVTGLLFMSATNAAFDVTTGDSFEVGVKSSFGGGRAQLTASVFEITQDDILTRDPANPAVTVQGGRQSSRGVELSLAAALTEQLRLEVGAMKLASEFDELVEAGGADRAGNRPANTPERAIDVVLTYAWRSAPLSLSASVRQTGDFYTSNANTVRVDGHTLIGASLDWRAPFATVTFRGRNLTDEFYADWSGFSSTQIYVGEPRSFEVALARSF